MFQVCASGRGAMLGVTTCPTSSNIYRYRKLIEIRVDRERYRERRYQGCRGSCVEKFASVLLTSHCINEFRLWGSGDVTMSLSLRTSIRLLYTSLGDTEYKDQSKFVKHYILLFIYQVKTLRNSCILYKLISTSLMNHYHYYLN